MKYKVLVGFVISIILSMSLLCAYSEYLYPCSVDNKYGFCDESRNIVIEPIWDYVSYFRDQKTAIVGQLDENGTLLMGIIDISGNVIIPSRYIIKEGEDELFGGADGFYSVQDPETEYYGYYDIKNNYFCEPVYFDVDIRSRDAYGLLPVIDPVTYYQGLIYDRNGDTVFPCEYLECYPANDGLSIAVSEEHYWILYASGEKMQIPDQFVPDNGFANHLVAAHNEEEDYYCLLNQNAEQVTFQHYSLIEFNQSLNRFEGKLNGNWETVFIEGHR